MDNQQPIIKITDLTIHYSNHPVLSDVNLEFFEGDFIYLSGESGSGKSTFLKSLYGDVKITKGEIIINNFKPHHISSDNLQKLRRSIGVIFQDFQLLTDRTIYENLKFVLNVTGWKNPHDIDERIKQVLNEVNLPNKEYKMIYELSGGEQQRVNIARAILNKPKVIIADEPTTNLDYANANEILKLLITISKEYNSLVIMGTHELNLIKQYPSKFYYISNNNITQHQLK